ncbi:putative UPF0481 protein At3g02645 [Solanum stenotomum]|uniref:putative UPF0481 protein At3g02645 n=1 Tax=Solanum stenotomum TaxID=172797 RepID=UPI0020D12252|nr:putative UPF0481 protein At3g02645 [Solanum stenotomum]
MTHSIEITSIDDNQTPLLRQTEKNKKEEGRKVDSIIENLNNSSIKSCTIFKVNVGLRESNPAAYTPKMVSIGPYHRKNPQLDPMEKYKLLYLQRFLKRNERPDVESCISELEKLKDEAIKCYEDIEHLDFEDSHDFCRMLLLDGCFVVEFMREHSLWCPKGEDRIIDSNYSCMYDQILRDLLLLENQLPLFVLNHLQCMTKQDDEYPFVAMAIISFRRVVNLEYMLTLKPAGMIDNHNVENIKHLLQAVHIVSCCSNGTKESEDDIPSYTIMPNATELSEAGVSFTKAKGVTSLFDIKFEKGLMNIPRFRIVDGTETILRNLIAYEQQSFNVQPRYFTDYAAFMDHLIDSDKDVNLLRQNGIIENFIGEDKDVASLFNKIGNGLMISSDDFYYKEECLKAAQHCKKPWNRMKANLKHNYFSSPWVGASTVAAIILLILTTIQTVLAFTSSVK